MPKNPRCEREFDEYTLWEMEEEAFPDRYVNSKERAEENRSSGWMLLVTGAIGMILVFLCMLKVIPLRVGNPYLFYGVLSAMFVVFMVMGVISIKDARIFAGKAESENSLKSAIRQWYRENLTKLSVDEEIENAEDLSEELLYFKRVDKLKEKLNRQFVNLDQPFLEHFIDEEIYDELFGDK